VNAQTLRKEKMSRGTRMKLCQLMAKHLAEHLHEWGLYGLDDPVDGTYLECIADGLERLGELTREIAAEDPERLSVLLSTLGQRSAA